LKKLCVLLSILLCSLGSFAQDRDNVPQPQAQESWFKDKLFTGGGFGLWFGNETYVNLSPQIGLQLDERWMVGSGVQYTYYSVRDLNYSLSSYGGSVFTRFFPIDNVFAQAEYEVLRGPWDITRAESFNANSLFVGGGYFSGQGRTGAFIMFLYNLNHSVYSPYADPYVLRMGFNVGF
jgi:hypothetical protein